MTHPDIERMERTGLKPFEKEWFETEEYDPWLDGPRYTDEDDGDEE